MKSCTRIMVHSHLPRACAHGDMRDDFLVIGMFGCGDRAWPCMILLYQGLYHSWQEGGSVGRWTCSKYLSEEVEDLPTRRCYCLCFQDYSVLKRLEDIRSSVVPAAQSYVTPGTWGQQGMSLCYCIFCRFWSHLISIVPLQSPHLRLHLIQEQFLTFKCWSPL